MSALSNFHAIRPVSFNLAFTQGRYLNQQTNEKFDRGLNISPPSKPSREVQYQQTKAKQKSNAKTKIKAKKEQNEEKKISFSS